ncbi:succinylarginine dihydrolase, partial [Salmonella enterica subsp. enterica serovar Dublin]|nr:succinylarginine dihydrolase [Salmonella enterica subsp. enterica serovar Dublin]
MRLADGQSGISRTDVACDIKPRPRLFSQGGGMTAHEVNFDGLVGLTHHYAGLS